MKLLGENIGEKFGISLSNNNFHMTQKRTINKSKNQWLGLHQTGKLLHSKWKRQQNKEQPTEWKKVFANHLSDIELISKI